MTIKIQKYGWKNSRPDQRNLKFFPKNLTLQTLPNVVDLRPHCSPVVDQGSLGACTANAADGMARFLMLKLYGKDYPTSRLATYYWERQLEGTVREDSGASILDSVKVMNQVGLAHESLWWYNIKKFAVKPSKNVVVDASVHKINAYYSVPQNLNYMKSCLADGYPFLVGFTVYDSFESNTVAKTGIMPMPKRSESVLGGHAVLVVGYDDAKQWWIVRNSWSKSWGDQGYFYMPYPYLMSSDLSADFWVCHSIEKV